jgi:hypothetical protein
VTRPWRDAEDDAALAEGGGRALVCSVCAAGITDDELRTERGGAHQHTFVNPGGFVHRVRCFAAARGVREVGAPEHAFSWFPGYSWQVLDCARCAVHIGWIYRCAGDVFYGLVADRLVER